MSENFNDLIANLEKAIEKDNAKKKKVINHEKRDTPYTQRRIWELTLYDDTIINTLREEYKRNTIKGYVGILHDKDIDDDGNPLKPHYHVFISCIIPMRKASIEKRYQLTPVQVNSIKHRIESAEEYLLHINSPEKYQYSSEDLFGDEIWVSEVFNTVSKERIEYGITSIVDFAYHCREPTMYKVLQYAIDNRLLNVYKKYYQIIRDIIRPLTDKER